jgi:hypothetical protein
MDHPATSLDPRCAIESVHVDHPTIANVSGTAARKIAPHHPRFFSKKPKAILRH